MKKRSLLALASAAAVLLGLVGCAPSTSGSGNGGGDGGLIGVAMPTRSSERWIQDGDALKKQLEDAGYTVDLQYA